MPTILAWNLMHGGGRRRTPGIVLALLDHAPDVVVLCEWRRTTGGQIAGILQDHGWRHHACTHPPPGVNGVLVASRTPLARVDAPGPVVDDRVRDVRDQRVMELALDGLGLRLIAAHVPCAGPERTAVLRDVVSAARRARDDDAVVIGDFNLVRDERDGAASGGPAGRALGELASLGYADAWRAGNAAAREFTWFSHDGEGFRLDQAWVSASAACRLESCRHSHAEREAGLSDHAAVLLSLRDRARSRAAEPGDAAAG